MTDDGRTNAAPALAAAISLAELWLLRGWALLGLGLSAFLMSVSTGQRAAPPGCGPGSGCQGVLASAWSQVAGMSVATPAMFGYLIAVLAFNQASPRRPMDNQVAAWTVLSAFAGILLAAAAWFTFVQVVILGLICPWCMVTHAVGVTLAVWVLIRAGQVRVISPRRRVVCMTVGMSLMVVLALTQVLRPSPPPRPSVAPAAAPVSGQMDTGVGPQRTLVLLQGALVLPFEQTPRLGPADAPIVLAVMHDYACPHCRRLHVELNALLERHGNMAVLSLPTPLNPACNPHLQETEPRFAESCELARLALAVWQADPQHFAAFEDWLYEPLMPRTAAEARAFAEGLVGAEPLRAALADAGVEQKLQLAVQAYGQARLERLPVIMSPRTSAVVGSPDAQELDQWLEQVMGSKVAPTVP